eukprot:7514040-Alexandrium_andersonii.AAC.1
MFKEPRGVPPFKPMIGPLDVARTSVYVIEDVAVEHPQLGVLPIGHSVSSRESLHQRGHFQQAAGGLH